MYTRPRWWRGGRTCFTSTKMVVIYNHWKTKHIGGLKAVSPPKKYCQTYSGPCTFSMCHFYMGSFSTTAKLRRLDYTDTVSASSDKIALQTQSHLHCMGYGTCPIIIIMGIIYTLVLHVQLLDTVAFITKSDRDPRVFKSIVCNRTVGFLLLFVSGFFSVGGEGGSGWGPTRNCCCCCKSIQAKSCGLSWLLQGFLHETKWLSHMNSSFSTGQFDQCRVNQVVLARMGLSLAELLLSCMQNRKKSIIFNDVFSYTETWKGFSDLTNSA